MYFNNGFDSTYEELISFYPNFYRKIFELRAILEAYGRICDNVIDTINAVLDNSFIETVDETMTARLEKFLGIEADEKQTLEERRSLVYAHFVGFGKISASKIKEIIKAFTGADSTVSFKPTDDAGNNKLIIEIDRGKNAGVNFAEINRTLASRLPAHIAYDCAVKYRYAVSVGGNTSPTHYTKDYISCGTMLAGDKVHIGELNIPVEASGEQSILGVAVLGLAELGNG